MIRSTNLAFTGLDRVAIVLVRPRYPENIGAAARIACNFGIGHLHLVADEHPDEERMRKMATHKAGHLIDRLQIFTDTAAAVADFHFIIGTTARLGRQRLPPRSPRQIMAEVAPLCNRSNIALMFGPENTGLENSDLDLCHYASNIPTASFSSLNLAQAVAIHCYELFMALAQPGTSPAEPEQDYANSFDMEGMYAHIEEALTVSTFLQEANHTYWMRNIRQFLGRVRLKKKEASMIRRICRKFIWYHTRHG